MRLLLAEVELADLGVSDDSDHRTKLLDPLDVEIDSPLLFFSSYFIAYLVKAFFFDLYQFL